MSNNFYTEIFELNYLGLILGDKNIYVYRSKHVELK